MEKQSKEEKIAAVVPTYNRKELLKECLDALLRQTYPVDSIILIDNASIDGTPEFLKVNGYLDNPKIDYVRLPENTGGAGGFYEGTKRGYEKGFDWLWLMDDDAEPNYDSLNLLIKNKQDNCVLTPLIISKDGKILTNHRGFINYQNLIKKVILPIDKNNLFDAIEISFTSFVGPLIPRRVVDEIGYPNPQFFIYHDDVEYCIRISRVRKIILVPKSVIIHKEESSEKLVNCRFIFFETKKNRIEINKVWRQYYALRNIIYISKLYQINRFIFYYSLLKSIIKTIIDVIIYDDFKMKRISTILKALIDGLRGRINKNIEPKIWLENI